MFFDEEEPLRKKPAPRNLEVMGVEELEEYIASQEAEIVRARAMIEKKKAMKAAAAGFFKAT